MSKQSKTKLELTWIGKDKKPKLEPRILVEDNSKSYHASHKVSEDDIFDNKLIYGDNLLALKALEAKYTGQVKCIYIDPPYNTGAAFDHYDDGLEHSTWLSLMQQRIHLLKKLLHEKGVIFVQIDDKEMAYLRILMDEVFERKNFLNMIVVKTSDPSGHKTVNPSPYSQTEYILMYCKDRSKYVYEQQYIKSDYDQSYGKYITNINEHYSKWNSCSLNEVVATHHGFNDVKSAKKSIGKLDFEQLVADFANQNSDSVYQATAISNAAGRAIVEMRDESKLNPGVVYKFPREEYDDVYILNGRQIYFYSNKIKSIEGELVPAKPLTNLWSDIPWNGIASEGDVVFKNGKKPEKLIKRCIEMSTDKGDIVLDSFAGSGTTGAVAHKMGRRWIMVELGEHCHTHIIPRLKKVIDGDDQSGISKSVNWQGGGGFSYYKLAPSLLEQDRWGRWVISKEYDAAMLAEAICKLEGFTYEPSDIEWWNHGYSTEQDRIYVTTQTLSTAQQHALSEEVGTERSLLVCCSAFQDTGDRFSNLTLKKIPKMVLSRCEWGHDDYSLNINNRPTEEETGDDSLAIPRQDGLFDDSIQG
ncbi:Adenine specific DNA methylase MOD [Alishewanella agri BL06]|uniref:site-specific DNA-methyltransferase (adenine-specific) n=1 Tax=Alishewanella agri BL06 TaxID=1195246 RepID=I8U6H2_9ALTE|nr:site-specific DNA-methyltransferase [Alishewanella agri]EIW88921.1 Adenine specific DNA methylase MOD [Alishewanella agri BL06]